MHAGRPLTLSYTIYIMCTAATALDNLYVSLYIALCKYNEINASYVKIVSKNRMVFINCYSNILIFLLVK